MQGRQGSVAHSSVVVSSRQAFASGRFPALGLPSVLLANIGVLLFYFYFDLSLLQLVFVYWWECVWIGAFAWLKMLVVSIFAKPFDTRRVSVSRGLAFLLTLITLSFVAGKYLGLLGLIALAVAGVAVEVLGYDGVDLLQEMIDPVLVVSLWLLLSHLFLFVARFLLGGEFRSARYFGLIGWSYARCGTLLLAMIAGLIFIALFPEHAQLFAAVLIVVKFCGDCLLTQVEMRPSQAT